MSKTSDRTGLRDLDCRRILVAPSILAADFTCLGAEIESVERAGAEVVHVDVMDGHFVPNLSVGPPVVKALRKTTCLPFDVHLMIDRPENFVEPFAAAGADNITVHVEASRDLGALLETIHRAGCSAGLVVKPATPVARLADWLPVVDLILIMSVEPGFGGQKFMESSIDRIAEVAAMIVESGRNIHLEVDGGIDRETAARVIAAGANLLVAGTSVFRHPQGCETAIRELRGT